MTIDTTKEAVEAALHPLIRMVADGYMLSEKEVSGILETMRALLSERDSLSAQRDDLLAQNMALKAERDAALAEAVKVTPLDWQLYAEIEGLQYQAYDPVFCVLVTAQDEACCEQQDSARAARIRAALEPDPERLAAALDDGAKFDGADWFWRVMDPDDCGDNPSEAMNRAMIGRFCICEIASSYRGPTRYGFIAPVLDPESDDEEFLHFSTQREAMDAVRDRAALAALKGGV